MPTVQQDRSDILHRFNTSSFNETRAEATSLHVSNRVLEIKKEEDVLLATLPRLSFSVKVILLEQEALICCHCFFTSFATGFNG